MLPQQLDDDATCLARWARYITNLLQGRLGQSSASTTMPTAISRRQPALRTRRIDERAHLGRASDDSFTANGSLRV